MTPTRELRFPGAVEEAQDLFDRMKPVTQLRDTLRRPDRRTVVILGGRLLGKTSMLNVVTGWAESQAGFVVVRLAHASSRDEFMAEVAHGIHEYVRGDAAGATAGFTTGDIFDEGGALRSTTVARFVKIVQDLTGRVPGVRFLLCVDEFDSLLSGCDERTARQILDLVLFLTEQARLPLRFLFTMSQVPDRIRLAYSSPFLNQATIVELRPWSAEESREFVDWLLAGTLRLAGDGHDALFAAAGGHPYFTKAVLAALLEQSGGEVAVAGAAVRSAVESAVGSREVDVALSNIAGEHFPASAALVLDRFAAAPAGLTAASLRDLGALDGTLETLTDSGLLSRSGARYSLRLGLWQQWRARRRPGPGPGRLARFSGAVQRLVGGRGVRVTLLVALVVLILVLAFGTAVLLPTRSVTFTPCDAAAAGLQVQISYPAYVSVGDQQDLQVRVMNAGTAAIDGSVLVRLLDVDPGQVRLNTSNVDSFPVLRPGQQQTMTVGFTYMQAGRILPDIGSRVPVELAVAASGAACPPRRWLLAVAPVPHLRDLQKAAFGLVVAVLVPLLLEWAMRRYGERARRGEERPGSATAPGTTAGVR
jgi:hypothetical protein